MNIIIFWGESEKGTISYEDSFYRIASHYSNLYWGVSLGAFLDYADKNAYYFGSNSAGNNAFFVRKDSIDEKMTPANSNRFVESKYRERRCQNGKLSFLSDS